MKVAAAGNARTDCVIQGCKVNIYFAKVHRQYPAADIHADNVWNHFIAQISGKADYAAGAGVHIRHDPDFALAKRRLLDKGVNLTESFGVNVLCKNF